MSEEENGRMHRRLSIEQRMEILRLSQESKLTYREIASQVKCSLYSVFKYLREFRERGEIPLQSPLEPLETGRDFLFWTY